MYLSIRKKLDIFIFLQHKTTIVLVINVAHSFSS